MKQRPRDELLHPRLLGAALGGDPLHAALSGSHGSRNARSSGPRVDRTVDLEEMQRLLDLRCGTLTVASTPDAQTLVESSIASRTALGPRPRGRRRG